LFQCFLKRKKGKVTLMPAPTSSQIKENIKIALLSQGYKRREIQTDVDGNKTLVEFDGQLMDDLDKIAGAIAEGIANTWTQWQSVQTVVGTATVGSAPGTAPVTGNLP
jgi:hypothetical protein